MLRVAHFFAKYSYGIYLSHIAVILWTFALPIPRAAQWAVFVPIAFLAPVAMFHLIENPMIQAGQMIARRVFTAPPAPANAPGGAIPEIVADTSGAS